MNKKSRSSVEMSNKKIRPEITDTDAHIKEYDTIILGFPIWWYVAPTIVNTFLEKYDFSGKRSCCLQHLVEAAWQYSERIKTICTGS